ncbi:MAG: transporter substrate-binding domain-containing protein [Bacteriovoracaceae bacterium]|nr:transporter substrate-binding domain-containing protein [Bacteriovoracaceae bacterium]
MKTLLCLLILSFSTLADGQQGLGQVQWGFEDGKLTVFTHYTPPWSFKECRGVEIDIIKAAFQSQGVEIHCASSSYERLVKMFVSKRALFASPVVPMENTKSKAYYSASFINYVDVVASYNENLGKLSDLKDKRIVAYQNAHSYLGGDFKEAVSQAESYTELPGRDGQLKMLANGRVDFIVGEWNILKHISNELFPDRKLKKHFVLKKWALGAGYHSKELMSKFNKGLGLIREAGVVDKIYKEYGIQR